MRTLGKFLLAMACVGVLLSIDAGTKRWATTELKTRGSRTLLGGQMVLHHQENTGILFGLWSAPKGTPQPFLIGYGAVLAAGMGMLLARQFTRRQAPGLLATSGLVMLLSGTLGNLRDRLERGFVVDFIDFGWSVFNFADVLILLGMGLCGAALVQGFVRTASEGRVHAALG